MKRAISIVALLLMLTPATTHALIYPFGGMIMWAYPCTCTGSYLVYVGLPRPASILVTPASRIFLNYMFFKPGTWVLGNAATVGAPCLNPVCYGVCCPTGYGLPVIIMGTSL